MARRSSRRYQCRYYRCSLWFWGFWSQTNSLRAGMTRHFRLVKPIVIGQFAETVLCKLSRSRFEQRKKKRETRMRILIAALAVMTTFPALADEADDAQRLAVAGRD